MLTSLWPHHWSETSVGRFPGEAMRTWVWELKFSMDPSYTDPQCSRFISPFVQFSWDHFSSVTQLCLTICNPMDCSIPGFPVHHQLLELTQTHVHWVGDAMQPSHPLLSPSPPALNLSQHQGLFKWASSSHQVAKVLEFQLKYQSVQWTFRTDFL